LKAAVRLFVTSAALLAFMLIHAHIAWSQPYTLKADAFAQAPNANGFVMLQGEARARTPVLVDAETLVWTGVGQGGTTAAEAEGEAVVASVRLRDTVHGVEARFGRLLYAGGAIRPLHIDGAVLTVRSPTGATLDVFGGIPVLARFQGRSFDWAVGGRSTQAIGRVANVGFSYWQERETGRVARSELGLEGYLTPWKSLAVTSTAAIDANRLGLAEARVSAMLHDSANRFELFGVRRNPSLMLSATSLFAALGSYDSDSLGVTGFWRCAPRLDLTATASVDRVADKPGATQLLRAELRLDDNGRGAMGIDSRRVSMPGASWTGSRGWLRLPIVGTLSASTELEIAVPDHSKNRGVAWPWWVVGLRYDPTKFLQAAVGLETSATPLYTRSVGGLMRLTGIWGAP
jgi:hypothetical protein